MDLAIHKLGYTQHGGSGYGWSPESIMDLEWSRILKFCERLDETREAEYKALKDIK